MYFLLIISVFCRMWCVFALALSLLVFGNVDARGGCRCKGEVLNHEQEYFCNADFVIRVTVLRQKRLNYNRGTKYFVRVTEAFKSNLYKGKETTLITGTAAQCGVVLDGKDFLVTGNIENGRNTLSSCNSWIASWNSLTKLERRTLRTGGYAKTCTNNCDVAVRCSKGNINCCGVSQAPCRGTTCSRIYGRKCGWTSCY
ncbi:metalloproteinase inhibitor 3 [Mytilus galloprovincialis]|uniref:Metalloproteinase inhibitor 3 n=3 Tax=Mytilus TaxID=6548 RepID=A0A8B6CQ08_MYTGA|nr:metalloproteinase inhibitor 3 [Mytilus galloprovincialis]